MLRRINIIAGPTAVGKTALALRWAQEHGAEIINADALLFYRGMDIGTAKPSAAEQALVPHHLIDVAAPTDPISIRHYVTAAEQIVRQIAEERGKPVLVVGGSGFYLRSFFLPVVDDVPPSAEIRAQVTALEAQGITALRHALREASPDGTGTVDMLNPRRIVRALERCLTTGRSVPQLEADFAALPRPFPDYEKRLCLLLAPNATLHPRIAARTRAMLQHGLLDEVRHLMEEGIETNPPAASAIGYRETIAWLHEQEAQPQQAGSSSQHKQGAVDTSALEAEINLNTRRLVAKQRKWFRNQVSPDLILERTAAQSDDALYAAICTCFA